MNEDEREHFSSEHIDEQIDAFLVQNNRVKNSDHFSKKTVQVLQNYYSSNEDYQLPIARVWQRLEQHRASTSPQEEEVGWNGSQSQRKTPMNITLRKPQTQSIPLRRLGLVAAVIVAVLLVGSLLTFLQILRQNRPGPATPNLQKTQTVTPTDDLYGMVTLVNSASYDRILYRYNPEKHKVLWKFVMPSEGQNIGPRPQVVNGVLYTLGGDQDGYYSYAINTSDGSLRWRFKVPYDVVGLNVEGPQFIANGTVYISEADSTQGYSIITALDASTGTVRWQKRYDNTGISTYTQQKDEWPGLFLQATTSGILYGSMILGTGANATTVLTAINTKDGTIIWQKTIPASSDTPDITEVIDGVLCLSISSNSTTASHLYGYDAQTGAEKWSIPLDDPVQALSISDGTLYVSTTHSQTGSDNSTYAASGSVYAIQASSGKQLWRYSTQDGGIASLTVSNEMVIVAISQEKARTPLTIVALDPNNGKARWTHSFSSSQGAITFDTLTGGKNFVYIATTSKQIQVLRLSDGKLVETLTLPDPGPSTFPDDAMLSITTASNP